MDGNSDGDGKSAQLFISKTTLACSLDPEYCLYQKKIALRPHDGGRSVWEPIWAEEHKRYYYYDKTTGASQWVRVIKNVLVLSMRLSIFIIPRV